MAEVKAQIKNLQETPAGTPYAYFDSKYVDALGLKAKTPIEISYDFDKREICIREAKPEQIKVV